jgi:hypothetical protein
MSGYRVTIKKYPMAFEGGPDHEITLVNPRGSKRWFTATGIHQARVIAQSWADFLDTTVDECKPDGS